MGNDTLRYDRMVEQALRGVVRQALDVAAAEGLPGGHHFYLTFRTDLPGVEIPDHLRARHPQEMTIVLQHQFSDLHVDANKFSVSLAFNGTPELLVVPHSALTAFVDPHVKFGLQFNAETSDDAVTTLAPANTEATTEADNTDDEAAPTAEVVTLDAFRKK